MQAFHECRDQPSGWIEVVAQLQVRVAAEFGLPRTVGVEAMQRADALLAGDPEVQALSLYRRHNRCKDGALQQGDPPPEVTLLPLLPARPTGHPTETLTSALAAVGLPGRSPEGRYPAASAPAPLPFAPLATTQLVGGLAAAAKAVGKPLVVFAGSYS